MKAIRFKESNFNIDVKGVNKEVRPAIPIRREKNGQVISCWRAPLKQRIAFLFHGKIWVGLQINQHQIPPFWVACVPTVFKLKQYIKTSKKNGNNN